MELRLEGYQREQLALRADSPSQLDITLKKMRTGAVHRPKASRKNVEKSAPKPPPRRRLSSEVVDPWAD